MSRKLRALLIPLLLLVRWLVYLMLVVLAMGVVFLGFVNHYLI